jgi:membrane protein YdbS with pleckstrin-like domain
VGREFTPKTDLPPNGVADDYAREFRPLIFFLALHFSNGAVLARSRYNRVYRSQEVRMAEMIIRPTMKFIYMGYTVAVLIVVALVVAMERIQLPPWIPSPWQPWIPWLPVLLLLWPLERHLRNRFTKMTILDDRLRYERGILGRTTRTVLISRVQDVTVHQRVGQRIFGVGDLSIETAGKSSWEAIVNIDRPQEIADHINEHSQRGHSKDQLT